jgi:hypothetical protein
LITVRGIQREKMIYRERKNEKDSGETSRARRIL